MVNLSLVKLTDLGRRTKVLEILPQVWHKWDFISVFYFNDDAIVDVGFSFGMS